jgi:hypothetical protein
MKSLLVIFALVLSTSSSFAGIKVYNCNKQTRAKAQSQLPDNISIMFAPEIASVTMSTDTSQNFVAYKWYSENEEGDKTVYAAQLRGQQEVEVFLEIPTDLLRTPTTGTISIEYPQTSGRIERAKYECAFFAQNG